MVQAKAVCPEASDNGLEQKPDAMNIGQRRRAAMPASSGSPYLVQESYAAAPPVRFRDFKNLKVAQVNGIVTFCRVPAVLCNKLIIIVRCITFLTRKRHRHRTVAHQGSIEKPGIFIILIITGSVNQRPSICPFLSNSAPQRVIACAAKSPVSPIFTYK